MATSTQLGKLAALFAQLGPLGSKSRGMRIEADEWNALVGVVGGLLEVEKQFEDSLGAQLEDEFAPKLHQHTGEVALEWLDPELGARIGSNGGGVSTRIALSDMQAALTALGSEVSRLTSAAEEIQHQLDRASAETLERAAKLNGFETRFRGIEDLRGLVAASTAQVEGLAGGIDAVLELRGSLKGVDVAGLQQRLASLETLNDNLAGVDGKPVRLVDVQVQLKELQTAVDSAQPGGVQHQFDALRDDLRTSLDQRLESGVAGAKVALTAQLANVQSDLSAQLDGKVESARTALASSVDAKLAQAGASLGETLKAQLAEAATNLRATLTTEAGGLVDARLAGLSAQVQAAVAAAAPALQAAVLGTLTAQLDTRTAALQADLAARSAAIEAQFAAQAAGLGALVADQTAEQLPGLLDARLATTAAQLASSLGARVDQQLAAARAGLASSLQDEVGKEVGASIGDLDGRVAGQVEKQLADLDSRVEAATANALEGLPAQVGAEVQGQLGKLELDGRMRQLESRVADSFASLSASVTDLQAQFKRDLVTVSDSVRTELATAQTAAVSDLQAQIERTQEALTARVDASAAATLDRTNALVTQLNKTLTPRLDQLEGKVFQRPTVPTSITTVTTRPVG